MPVVKQPPLLMRLRDVVDYTGLSEKKVLKLVSCDVLKPIGGTKRNLFRRVDIDRVCNP